MSDIKFSKDEKTALTNRLKLYFREELDQELGQFDAEFLLDFITEELGTYFYNQGLLDAQAVLEKRMETISEAIAEIEKPTKFRR